MVLVQEIIQFTGGFFIEPVLELCREEVAEVFQAVDTSHNHTIVVRSHTRDGLQDLLWHDVVVTVESVRICTDASRRELVRLISPLFQALKDFGCLKWAS